MVRSIKFAPRKSKKALHVVSWVFVAGAPSSAAIGSCNTAGLRGTVGSRDTVGSW